VQRTLKYGDAAWRLLIRLARATGGGRLGTTLSVPMRAILIREPHDCSLVECPVPTPAAGEVLVELRAMALCNQHDLKVNRGGYRDQVHLEYGVPGFPGHEGTGVVRAVGAGVTDFAVGDRVAMSGLGGPPLYAEWVTRRADEVARVPATVPLEEVAMAELAGCVHRAVAKVGDYRSRAVVVSGGGAAGLVALQLARARGAIRVTLIEGVAARRDLARELGADAVVDPGDEAAMAALRAEGAAIVIECSGHRPAYAEACRIAREAVVIFGYAEGTVELPLWPLFDRELTIHNSKWLTRDDLQAVVDLIAAGQLRTAPLITHRFAFERYPEAVAAVARGEVIKALLLPGPPATPA
jgi:L-iditol 2-dehydrogenase